MTEPTPDTIRALQTATLAELLDELSVRTETAILVYRLGEDEAPVLGQHGDTMAALGMLSAATDDLLRIARKWCRESEEGE